MSIKLIIQAQGLNIQAAVTDAALSELIRITQEYRDQEADSGGAPLMTSVDQPKGSATPGEEATKGVLASYCDGTHIQRRSSSWLHGMKHAAVVRLGKARIWILCL